MIHRKHWLGHTKTYAITLLMCVAACALIGCETVEGNIGLGAAGVTLLGARTPAQEIETIYYLGVFDAQEEQLPPTVYRLRLHGQASILSGMKFGTGWVQASLVDSLGTHIGFDKDSNSPKIDKGGDTGLNGIQTGRRLVLFGPQGFREAPKDHRLVVVMGSSPDDFFAALDQSLGIVSQAVAERKSEGIDGLLFTALTQTKAERERLDDLVKDVESDR